MLALVAGFNWMVDPFSIWHASCVESVNCRKTEAGDKIYVVKAYQWRDARPDIVVLGNSRPELGIDPESPYFNGSAVYNLAIRGAGLVNQVDYMLNLLARHNPERVIISVDFLDFLQSRSANFSWPPETSKDGILPFTIGGETNPYYLMNDVKTRLNSVLSLNSFLASVKTVLNQDKFVNYTRLDGFNDALGFIPIVNYEGTKALFEQKENALIRRLAGKEFDLGGDGYRSKSFRALELLVDSLARRNIKLDIFISPYHQRYLDVVHRTGHFALFQEWKEALVDRLADVNYFSNGSLLDFSGFNRFTREPVPSESGMFMQWYWEPSHYRAALGEEVVRHILSKDKEFELSPENIEIRLAAERESLQDRVKETAYLAGR